MTPAADASGSISEPSMLLRGLHRLETVLFRNRAWVLCVLAALTLGMGFFAGKLRMDAGFEKQLPMGHEYIETFKTIS